MSITVMDFVFSFHDFRLDYMILYVALYALMHG